MVVTFRPRALIAAVRDAWPAWLALIGIIVAGTLGWMLSANASASIRYAGAVLQVLGLAMVAIGLSEVRRSFGKPSLPQRVLAWFGKIWAVFRPPKPIILEATAGAMGIATGRARAVVAAGPGASLDQRVAILEGNLTRLQDTLDVQRNEIGQELLAVRDALGREQRARETESSRMAVRLEELAVGGLHLEWVGLSWLVLGVFGTSIPDEIATLLHAVVDVASHLLRLSGV